MARPRPVLLALAGLVVLASAVATALPARADDDPAVIGAWSAPFDLQVVAIHDIVLPGGKVLLFHRPQLGPGSEARVWDPVTGSLTDVSFTAERDVFCSGHTVLPDGRVLVVGGHVHGGDASAGVRDTDLFDPATATWTAGPSLRTARWYPSAVELGDGSALVLGGTVTENHFAKAVESFDPASATLTSLGPSASKNVHSYPRAHVLPDGRLFLLDQTKPMTSLFDPATGTWSALARMNFGKRGSGSTVLLPGLRRILAVGGSKGGGATATAEVIDPLEPAPAWRFTGSMTYPRKHLNAVLLADGTVLAVGGGGTGYYGNPMRTAELYDLATETWSVMATQAAPRMYHSTAVLLPDGRVLSAGQDLSTAYPYTGEIYSPPYLFRGDRPEITAVDSSVTYGEAFAIQTPAGPDVRRVALVRPGSATHSVDFDQRYVDLSWTVDESGNLLATAPADGNQAPPGWYMLFVVNADGVPSTASWVHVGDTIVPGLPAAAMAGSSPTSTHDVSFSGFPLGSPDGSVPSSSVTAAGLGNEDRQAPASWGLLFRCSRRPPPAPAPT